MQHADWYSAARFDVLAIPGNVSLCSPGNRDGTELEKVLPQKIHRSYEPAGYVQSHESLGRVVDSDAATAPDRLPVLRQAPDDELAAEAARRQQPVLEAQGADQDAAQRPRLRQVHHLKKGLEPLT